MMPTPILSCRTVMFLLAITLALISIPYLTLTEHSDTCYVTRSPLRMMRDSRLNDAQAKHDTGGLEIPAMEAVESTPSDGRKRHPRWFFKHQTIIMIVLLIAATLIKLINAFMNRPKKSAHTTSATLTSSDAEEREQLIEMSTVNSNSKRTKSSSKSSTSSHSVTTSSSSNGRASSNSLTFNTHWYEVFRVLFIYLMYLSSYFLCQALKTILGDTNCSTHGNSVSGHFLFFSYCMWMLGYIHISQKKLHTVPITHRQFWSNLCDLKNLNDIAFAITYFLFTLVTLSILCDTYFYGYHSMRQVIYGTLLAFCVFLCVTGILEVVEVRLEKLTGYSGAAGKNGVDIEHTSSSSSSASSSTPNPVLALSYSAYLSGLLYEWSYMDEISSRFYTFPLFSLFLYQGLAWLLLASSPKPFNFHAADVITVAAGYGILMFVWWKKLQLPIRR